MTELITQLVGGLAGGWVSGRVVRFANLGEVLNMTIGATASLAAAWIAYRIKASGSAG